MSAAQDIRLKPKAIERYPALELEREEPVTLTAKYPDGHGRPLHEVAARRKDCVCFGPLVRFPLGRNLWWNVMQEVLIHIELFAVTTGRGGTLARVLPARVVPPCTWGLAWVGNHRVDEDDLCDDGPGTHHGRRETAERLRNKHDVVPATDCLLNQTRVLGQARIFVVPRKIDGDSIVTCLPQEGDDAAPIPG